MEMMALGCTIINSEHGSVVICRPTPIKREIIAGECSDCKRRSRFLVWIYEFYGATRVCLRCGRTWIDGEWMPLTFERGSRAKSVARAKHAWRKDTAIERKICLAKDRDGTTKQ